MRVPVQIYSCSKSILGVMHISHVQLDIPIVAIMCYGLNGSRVEQHRMSVKFGDICVQNNVNLVRFDYSNVGVSEGDFIQSSIKERVQNIIEISELINGCFNGIVKIYLIGFSDGAKIAIQAKPFIRNYCGLVLWNPILNIPNKDITSSNIYNSKLLFDKNSGSVYKPLLGAPLNINILKELKNDESIAMLNDDKRKLFVFGSLDKYTIEINKYLRNSHDLCNAIFREIRGAGHLFCQSYQELEVNNLTVEWILKETNYVV